MTTPATQVRDNPDRSRYELVVDGAVVGIADYRAEGDVVVLPHTVIEPARRGQGLGAVLIRHVLDDLRSKGKTVVPACWFVAEFIETNPSYSDLVAA
jgi:predicted GNAT family acetyltransferase